MVESSAPFTDIRPVWYAGRDSALGELWTMLHLPYTMMVLSFVTLGAVVAGRWSWTTLATMLLLYFLGLGLGSHLLDQVSGMGSKYTRHWSDRALWIGGFTTLGLAAAIGLAGGFLYYGRVVVGLVAVQAFVALAYPLGPIFRGWFHGDIVFAVSWGSLPFLTGFFVQGGAFGFVAAAFAAGLAAVSFLEIRLSRLSRSLRNEARELGHISSERGEGNPMSYQAADLALKSLAGGVYLVTFGFVLATLVAGVAL